MAERERAIPGNFGIQTPPLLEYLQGILRGYSDGQILKELLQNAEDAGASEIRFLYDENNYGTESLLKECLKNFQGPALCSYNNALFQPKDWDGIQKPAQSCKKNDVLKVGRFGIGFNSVYHLTDLPCIISQNILAMIDPFEKHFFSERRPLSGYRWDLGLMFENMEDQLRPFQEAFPEDIQFEEQGNLPGTFFRFPLRKEPNTLSQSVFSPEKIHDLLEAFKEDAKIVLLFLRNIEKASIYWKKEHCQTSECFVEVSFVSSYIDKLRQDRERFTSLLQNFKDHPDESENIEIINTFDIVTKYFDTENESKNQFEEKWVVAQEIAITCSSTLTTLYRKLNYLPWIGVAVPVFNCKETLKGRTFCFLPLPSGEDSLSELPVHVHGFFGVSDDRRSLKWPGGDQIQNDDAEWNKLLVNEVLPGVYRKALLKAIEVTLKQNDPDPNIVYKAIPNINHELGHWREAVETLFSNLFHNKVLYCRARNAWLSVKEVIIMTEDLLVTSKKTRAIVKCLQNSGYDVIENLPGHVMDAIRMFAKEVRYVSPSLVIECLKTQSDNQYSDRDRLHILDYILENFPKPEDVDGLKLLPTCDGQFASFKTYPNTSEVVYMETSTCSQNLIPGMCQRFVKRLQEEHFSKLNHALEIMTSSENWKQLEYLDSDVVIQLLPETLPTFWKQVTEDYVDWTPCKDHRPDLQWLQLFWHFLCREDIDLVKLEGFKILPVSEITKVPIRMMALKSNSRIIHVGDADKAVTDFAKIEGVLIKVGITVCELPDFVSKHHQILKLSFVHCFHQDDIMNALKTTGVKSIDYACSSSTDTQDMFYSNLLPYLSGANFSEQDICFLRSLSVFKAFESKQVVARLSSIDSGVIFLYDEDLQRLPEVPFHKLYVIINTCEHLLLLEKLGVKLQSFEDALAGILRNAQQRLYSQDKFQVLFEWVRLHYDKISCLKGIANLLKEIPFVTNGNEKLTKAKNMYDGSNKFVKCLVHDKDVLLSEHVLSSWLDILSKLGLKTEDNIEVHHLMKAAMNISSENNVSQADVLVEYLGKYPQCLENTELCNTLKQLPFISCKYVTPSFYPKEMTFFGKQGKLYKPSDLVVYSRKTCCLAGASAPMVQSISDKVLEQLIVRKKPSVKEVLQQLHQCVKCNSSKTEMIQYIYEFLNENSLKNRDEVLAGLPEKWIFVDDHFVNVSSVYKEECSGAIDLRPFLCILPSWYKEYDNLLEVAGVPDQVDGNMSFLVDVLGKIKANVEASVITEFGDLNASLRVSVNILRKLVESEDEIEHEEIRCKLYVPTNCKPMKLLPPDQVCYDDMSYDNDEDGYIYLDEEEPPIYLVHSDVPSHIAKKLGVVSLTKRLAGADEIGGIAQTGQYEPITVRLRNILKDGYQPESIPKEMIQNAEDAGASEVKFLLDLRTNRNAVKRLLDPAMESVHGPALWVYNNAAFTDEDLQNITKLGGATKSEDQTKIGQFGLGFNAVYHITDVPSFVTGNFITFFDPHKCHLQRHIRGDGRGIQLNFTSNPSRMRRFRDQFVPYEDIFGCKILDDEKGSTPYNNTLFRLPLRTVTEARKSEIWNESYNEENMKILLTSLCRNACQMLLFTENVQSISVYLLREDENCKPSLLYQLHKETTEKCPVESSFRETVFSFVNNYSGNSAPLDTASVVTLQSEFSEKGTQYLQIKDVHPVTLETWIVIMSAGTGRTLKLCLEDIGMKSGLLPCGGVAWNRNVNTGGGVFCFLPLSVPQSGLPICINGSFAVSADRRSICRKPESGTSDFKTNWNESLLEDVIVSAYVTLLQQAVVKEYANRCSDPFALWPNPLKISKNSDYGAVMTGFYEAIICGINGKTPPTIFMKKDGIYTIDDVVFTVHEIQNDNEIFHIVERVFQRISSKKVIRIPTWVRTGFEEAGYSVNISNMTYSWKRFFKDIFLPHLPDIQHEDVLSLVSHALAEHDDTVLDLMKVSECIPSKTSHGRIYKAPSSLLDPDRFKDIFFEDEGVFPEYQFLEALDMRQKGTLKEIGCLNKDLSWDKVLERTKTVQCLWRTDIYRARQRVNALLDFMDSKLKAAGHGHQNVENDLKEVKFLPAVLDGDVHLESPSNIYLAEERNLVGLIRHILDTSNTQGTPSQSVCRLLGLHGKKVKAIEVIKNLCRLKEINGKDFDSNSLQKQCESIYVYLQQHLQDEDVLHFLRNETVFCLHQEFIETKKLAFFGDSFSPYLFQIPEEWKHKFHTLFKAAGVKEFFDCNDFIRTLSLIKEEKNGEPLDQEMVSTILTKVIIPLCKVADNIPSKQVSEIPLPDSEHTLQPSGSLSYCDLDTFKDLTSEYKLCHKEISSFHAKKLGVRDIRDQMLRNYSENLPGYGGIGESFGQREELVTRITRIMEGYPCDFSILKELVQNADDANATKVHFVLDKREHRTNRLFYNSMSELQGPALLAYNNKPFTDDDIRGIQRLGEGSKSDDCDKTGRYGVGFNVVYHLTDCPMFLSGGNTLCIFDPTLQYVTNAGVLCPGRMFRPIDRTMLDSYCDLFNCFFSFKNDFKLEEGTLFRFPLRRKNSEISGKISPSHIEKLFENFKDEMFDILLFLKNVTEISFSTCTNGNLDTTYTVTANFAQEQANKRQHFFQRMAQQKESNLLEIPMSDLQYEVSIGDNDGRLEEWLVHQRVGIDNKHKIPQSVKYANTVTKLKLLPKGGAAAMLRCVKSGKKMRSKIDGKAFCFLPLPIKTNLPVHVDGYFALGHEARRHLWEAPAGDPKGDWNRLIAKEIIAPVYVQILKKIKANVTDFARMGINVGKLKDRLNYYHSLFPLDFKAGKLTSQNAWDELGQEFYQIVLQEKYALFPVVHFEDWRRTQGQTGQVESDRTNVHLSWKSCVVNADNEGYFDDLHVQFPKQETEKENDKEIPKFLQLRHLLLNLGFPLLETPLKVYNIIQRIISSWESETSIVLKINPDCVESWLKNVTKTTTLQGLPLHLRETRIYSNRNLHLLVEYVTNAPELKLCGLPLLLTNDGVLREFSLGRKVFHSTYHSLLPKCAGEFLHSEFLDMFNEEDECFVRLELSDLVYRLPTQLPVDQFCTGEYTPWHQDTITKLFTPRADWVKKLWKFFFENRQTPDWKANVVQALDSWSILPVHGENQDMKHLVPLNLAKTILSPKTSCYHDKMKKILKCLHCPMVDTTTLNDVHVFSFYQPTVEDFCQFVMSFASNLDNAENILLVFKRLINRKLHRFGTLGKEDHTCILNYFSEKTGLLSRNSNNLIMLKSLPCFETIHGDFVALTGKTIYAVVIENVPKCDQEIWISQSGSVFLKHITRFAELFKFLGVEDLSDVELYKKFILPCFRQFSVAAQWAHLSRIIDMIRTNLKPENIISILNLTNMQVVPQENGHPRLASSLCDEENPVFREMLEKRYFPPKHPDQEYQIYWLPFLRQLGMQTEVSCAQFEDFATTLSKEDKNLGREQILIDYFFENHHLHNDRSFLSRLVHIPFISSADTPINLRELHEPCITKKVTLTAVPEGHQTLVWTKEAVLPSWVCFKQCGTCKTGDALDTVLSKTQEPSLDQVFSHTQTLCCSLAKFHESPLPLSKQHPLLKHERVLNQVIMDILKFLSEKCEKAIKCDPCADKRKCCVICEKIVKALEDIPVVPLKGGILVKAKRLTKQLPKKENDKLFLFLNKLPDQFIPYCKLLFCMGTTEEPSLIQYASTLKLIKQQSLSDQQNNPNILRAAEQAVECFFRVLAGEENAHLGEIGELFLLTSKKQCPLLKSTELYYNDEPSYASRLKCFPHALMRTVNESTLRSYLDMEQLVGRLQHLRPQLISEAVDEIVTISEECSKPKSTCRCTLSQQLKQVFSWRTFSPALKIILSNEDNTDGRDHDEIFETNFTVQCLDEIPTELHMKDGTVIPESQLDAGVIFRRTGIHEVEVVISHSANDALIHIQIVDGFNHFFGNFLKSTKFLDIVFKSKSEEDVIVNLSRMGLKTTPDELQDLIANSILGSSIEEDVICLLIQDPFCHFPPNEYVGYNDTHGEDEHCVYAKIIRKVDSDTDINNEHEFFKVKYIIEVSSKNQIEVDAIWLYKFMRPKDEPSMPDDDKTHLYNPNGPPSSSTDVTVFEGQPNQQPSENSDDFRDLEKTKRELTKIIEDLWKQEDSVRRTALRRLLRKWHPDKHKEENKKFAEEIFKHIRREIERMEKGIPSGVDTDHDIFRWAQQNTAEQRQYWQFYQRRYGKGRRRGRRGRRSRGGGWNTSSSTDFNTPPSFHKINLEACKWLRQARIDLEAAAAVVNEEKNYFQWKSSLCFFAVEKSVKAAQLVCGCGMSDKHSLMDAALKVKRHLDITEAIQQLVQIVEKNSHYPSFCFGNSIPHENFTREHADEAMNIADGVILKVDHYVKFG